MSEELKPDELFDEFYANKTGFDPHQDDAESILARSYFIAGYEAARTLPFSDTERVELVKDCEIMLMYQPSKDSPSAKVATALLRILGDKT